MTTQENSRQFSLEGRVALVTGSTRGLGKAIAMSLGKAGAKVVINYYNDRKLGARTFEEFRDLGYEGALAQANVIDPEDVTRMVKEVKDTLGPIDVIVPNATPDQPLLPIEEYDWEFYQLMIDFFIKSPFLLTRAVLPHMKEQRWGRIINIASEVFQRGVGNFTAYVAAKGGQIGFNRSLATEVASFGITANVVSPGWIPVERHENDPQELKDEYLAGLPSKRWGIPQEVGDVVTFLASDEAAYVSGQNISVNGAHTVA